MIERLDWKGIAILGIAAAAYVAVAIFAPDFSEQVLLLLAALGFITPKGALKPHA